MKKVRLIGRRFSFFILVLMLLTLFCTLFLDVQSWQEVKASQVFLPPSFQHWLGTDSLGRDYALRLLLGLRTSFLISLLGTSISFVIGVGFGNWAAWTEEKRGSLLNRFFDFVQSIPSFLILAIAMQFFLKKESWVLILAMGIGGGFLHWPQLARLTRAQLFKTMREPYVEAAYTLGGTPLYISMKHLWPSAYAIWLAWFGFHLPGEIMFESTLSFLGFGVQPPQTSLGLLMSEGWRYLDDRPIFLFAPALLSLVVVLSFRMLFKKPVN